MLAASNSGVKAPPLPRLYWCYGFVFKTRGLLMALLLVAMFFITRGEGASSLMNWSIGLLLFGAGWALRVRSQQYLQYRLAGEKGLAMAGPYSYLRNPVYVANITGLAGLCILCNLYWMGLVVLLWGGLVYGLAVRFEEMRLLKRFGEPYRSYCERVPRWIPHRSPSPALRWERARFWTAAGVEWQNLVLLLVPLGKALVRRTETGKVHDPLVGALGLISDHRVLWLTFMAVAVVVLAALNLARLRSHRSGTVTAPPVDSNPGRG